MEGIRILDLTVNLPGPYATLVMAGMGADVVKIEPPRGDPARQMGGLFARLNAGKRSVVLDLRDPDGQAQIHRLIAWADVLIESFRPGVTERLGCGPEQAHAINPSLVYCRISGFGQTSSRAREPAHDLNLQAISGLCHLERDSRGRPRPNVLPLADLTTSLAAVSAICSALLGPRDKPVIDLGMADSLLSFLWVWEAANPMANVDEMARTWPAPARRILGRLRRHLDRERLYAMPQYGLYRTADGWISIGIVSEQHFWEGLCDGLGMPYFKAVPLAARTALGRLIRKDMSRRIRRRTTAHWTAHLGRHDLPVTPVHDLQRAMAEVAFARLLDDAGSVHPPGTRMPEGTAPALGEHTQSVLDSL